MRYFSKIPLVISQVHLGRFFACSQSVSMISIPRQPYPMVANSPNFPSSFMSATSPSFNDISLLEFSIEYFNKRGTKCNLNLLQQNESEIFCHKKWFGVGRIQILDIYNSLHPNVGLWQYLFWALWNFLISKFLNPQIKRKNALAIFSETKKNSSSTVRNIQISKDQLLSELNLRIVILKPCRPLSERQRSVRFIAINYRTENSLDLHSASEDA